MFVLYLVCALRNDFFRGLCAIVLDFTFRIIQIETILLHDYRIMHSYVLCGVDEYARRSKSQRLESKRLTTFRQIGIRRDKLLGMYCDRELNSCARVGLIFPPEEKKNGRGGEAMHECVGKRQAENDQPYRQTVGRLILPGVYPPATLSIRPRGMRSIPSRVINNIWRLVFLRERSDRCYDGGGARGR